MDSSVPFSRCRPLMVNVSERIQCAEVSGVSTAGFFLLPIELLYSLLCKKSN